MKTMKPEYLEPWKQNYPTKTDLLNAWSDWFESKSDEWDLFALTVVFKAGGRVSRPDRWESEYKTRVLLKIKRSLERNQKNFDFAIPFEDFCYYEFDEASIFRIPLESIEVFVTRPLGLLSYESSALTNCA